MKRLVLIWKRVSLIIQEKKPKIVELLKKWDNKFFVQIYLNHLRSILSNLNDKWINAINNGELLAHKLAFMSHQELDYDKWSRMIELKSKRDKNKFETNMAASTDTFNVSQV